MFSVSCRTIFPGKQLILYWFLQVILYFQWIISFYNYDQRGAATVIIRALNKPNKKLLNKTSSYIKDQEAVKTLTYDQERKFVTVVMRI